MLDVSAEALTKWEKRKMSFLKLSQALCFGSDTDYHPGGLCILTSCRHLQYLSRSKYFVSVVLISHLNPITPGPDLNADLTCLLLYSASLSV